MKQTGCSRVNGSGLCGASSWLILMTNPVVNDRAVSLRFTMCLTRPISVQLTFTRLLVRDITLLFVFRPRRSSQGRREGNGTLICIVTRVTHLPPEPLMQWWHRGRFPATLREASEQHVGSRLDALKWASSHRVGKGVAAAVIHWCWGHIRIQQHELHPSDWQTTELHMGVRQWRQELISRCANQRNQIPRPWRSL